MKIAVVLAHPDPTSFNASLAKVCVSELRALGHDPLLRDLYWMDFDPRLKRGEIAKDAGYAAARDVVEERRRLSDMDAFVFVYPFWFNAPPAILKGYVDRVFSMDFGYAPDFGGTRPLLGGKTLLSFSTSGAPDHWVRSTGALEALMQVFDLHLAGVCGLSTSHTHFGSVVPNLTAEAAEDMFQQARDVLRRRFPGHAAALRTEQHDPLRRRL